MNAADGVPERAEEVPASADAFVWLALYIAEDFAGVGTELLWWTLRRPRRPLTYHAARAVLIRAQRALGTKYRLHVDQLEAVVEQEHDPTRRPQPREYGASAGSGAGPMPLGSCQRRRSRGGRESQRWGRARPSRHGTRLASGAMGERAYELRKNWFGGPQAFAACLFVVFAVIEALDHDVTTSWILVAFAVLSGGMAAYWLLWKPYRIVLDDAGVRMVSRVRPVVVVPWSELDSVNVEWGRFGGSLDWQYVDGRSMATSGLFADLHQMLVEIERRAPHVSVTV